MTEEGSEECVGGAELLVAFGREQVALALRSLGNRHRRVGDHGPCRFR
jgi:hypothetical protein